MSSLPRLPTHLPCFNPLPKPPPAAHPLIFDPIRRSIAASRLRATNPALFAPVSSLQRIRDLSRRNPRCASIHGAGAADAEPMIPKSHNLTKQEALAKSPNGYPRYLVMTGVSVGVMVLLLTLDAEKAMAFGPEGPLVEEFWDNVRRYALYALTVSTGAIYAVVEPIFELLKNPISAILIIVIIGGSLYIMSQVLSAMVGVSEFAYDYGY